MILLEGPEVVVWGREEEELCFLTDATRCGRQSLVVLYDPRISMSMTDLKPLGESWERGTRKLPAAPALYLHISKECEEEKDGRE